MAPLIASTVVQHQKSIWNIGEAKMDYNILVFNCGSSSLKYKVYQVGHADQIDQIASGIAHRVGVKSQEASFIENHYHGITEKLVQPFDTHRKAASLCVRCLHNAGIVIDVVGHRFVHGGTIFKESTMITKERMKDLRDCLPLAPIHNPNSMSVIEMCVEELPGLPQYVCCDTMFHTSIPAKAYSYALPQNIVKRFGFRKIGYHGLSYQFVTDAAARFLKTPKEDLKMIICHLGTGGSSVAAVDSGKSVETSMGYSSLTGLIMNTRVGDLDPMIPVELIQSGYTMDEIVQLLYKESGLIGISGYSSDIRDLIAHHSDTGDENCGLAIEMYVHRLRHYIGAYLAILGGLDALIFTDDVGIQGWQIRGMACRDMEWAGIALDPEVNRWASHSEIALLNTTASKIRVLSVPNDEEIIIATEGVNLLGSDLEYQEAGDLAVAHEIVA
jgi:acetate kinase